MPSFGERSEAVLATVDADIVRVMREVVKHFDCRAISGHRGEEEQERLFAEGKTKARYGQSPHNRNPSMAVDIVPYPVDWQDTDRMTYFAGFVVGTAKRMGVDLTWGGDWNRDTHLSDNRFDDFPHFEKTGWRDG